MSTRICFTVASLVHVRKGLCVLTAQVLQVVEHRVANEEPVTNHGEMHADAVRKRPALQKCLVPLQLTSIGVSFKRLPERQPEGGAEGLRGG